MRIYTLIWRPWRSGQYRPLQKLIHQRRIKYLRLKNMKQNKAPCLWGLYFRFIFLEFLQYFDVFYDWLISAILFFIFSQGNMLFILYGILTLTLCGGDAFHLVPRIIRASAWN